MGLTITNELKWNIKRIVFCIIAVVIIVTVASACITQYREYRSGKIRETNQRIAQQEEKQRLESLNKSKQDAIIARLVSVCLESQARYDAASVKDRGIKARPDCTVTTE